MSLNPGGKERYNPYHDGYNNELVGEGTGLGSATKRFLENSTALLLSQVVGHSIRLITFAIIARNISVGRYGDFTFFLATIAILEVTSDFGLRIIVVQDGARNLQKLPELVGRALYNRIGLGVIALLAAWVSMSVVLSYSALMGFLVGLIAITQFPLDPGIWRARAYERMRYEAALFVSERALFMILVLIMIAVGASWEYLVGMLLVSNITRLVASFRMASHTFGHIDYSWNLRQSIAILAKAMPLGIAYLLSVVYYRAGIILLQIFQDSAEIGLFGSAFTFFQPLLLFPVAVVTALLPPLARASNGSGAALSSLIRLSGKGFIALALPVMVTMLFFAEHIIRIPFGMDYVEAAIDVRILAIALPLLFLNFLFRFVLTSVNRQSRDMIAMIVGLSISLAIGVILIPSIGHVGAAIALVSGEITIFCVKIYFMKNFIMNYGFRSLLSLIGAAVIMAIVITVIMPISPMVALLAGLMAYVSGLYLLPGITRKDLDELQHALAQSDR